MHSLYTPDKNKVRYGESCRISPTQSRTLIARFAVTLAVGLQNVGGPFRGLCYAFANVLQLAKLAVQPEGTLHTLNLKTDTMRTRSRKRRAMAKAKKRRSDRSASVNSAFCRSLFCLGSLCFRGLSGVWVARRTDKCLGLVENKKRVIYTTTMELGPQKT